MTAALLEAVSLSFGSWELEPNVPSFVKAIFPKNTE